MNFLNDAADVIYIGFLWLLFSVPIITIGPATCGAYYAMAKVVRHKRDTVFHSFIEAFKNNLKQGMVYSIIYVLLLAFMIGFVMNYEYLIPQMSGSYLTMLVMLGFTVSMTLVYIFPVMSRYKCGMIELFKYSVVMSVSNPIKTLALILLVVFFVILSFMIPFLLAVLPGPSFLISTYLLEGTLKKYIKIENDNFKDADDIPWYLE
ncbi:MAG: DUF624 domain-containing protein [Lachnospiraceae bacterium]|nr:DUF624 domain-containing protein [Lachnospiraceae bacterium]